MEKIKGTNQRAKEYKIIIVNGKKIYEYHHIWEKHNGKKPKEMMIHHINYDKKDNRIENLMLVSRKEHGKLHRKENKKIIHCREDAYKVILLTD